MDKLATLKQSLSADGERPRRPIPAAWTGAFLLKGRARRARRPRGSRVTALSESYAKVRVRGVEGPSRGQIGARQILIETGELEQLGYRENSPERCFFCKERALHEAGAARAARGAEVRRLRRGSRTTRPTTARAPAPAKTAPRPRRRWPTPGLTKLEIRRLCRASSDCRPGTSRRWPASRRGSLMAARGDAREARDGREGRGSPCAAWGCANTGSAITTRFGPHRGSSPRDFEELVRLARCAKMVIDRNQGRRLPLMSRSTCRATAPAASTKA